MCTTDMKCESVTPAKRLRCCYVPAAADMLRLSRAPPLKMRKRALFFVMRRLTQPPPRTPDRPFADAVDIVTLVTERKATEASGTSQSHITKTI